MYKFLIGLILGVAIASGIAIYLNSAPLQISAKNVSNSGSETIAASAPIILAPGTKIQEETSKEASKPTASAAYDFYDVLQGKPASDKINASKENAVVKIFVLVGAFSDQNDANDAKAKVALLGFDSKIKAEHEGDQIINQVIIGPLPNQEEAEQIIKQLANEEITATMIKTNQ